jgi:hypothetical protein
MAQKAEPKFRGRLQIYPLGNAEPDDRGDGTWAWGEIKAIIGCRIMEPYLTRTGDKWVEFFIDGVQTPPTAYNEAATKRFWLAAGGRQNVPRLLGIVAVLTHQRKPNRPVTAIEL